MKENQITFTHEILDKNLADQTIATKDDIVRINALILIAKNLSKAKNIEDIEKTIEEHMGPKNAVNFFLSRTRKKIST